VETLAIAFFFFVFFVFFFPSHALLFFGLQSEIVFSPLVVNTVGLRALSWRDEAVKTILGME